MTDTRQVAVFSQYGVHFNAHIVGEVHVLVEHGVLSVLLGEGNLI